MSRKLIEKLLKTFTAGEIKALDEACEKQLKATEGKGEDTFMWFAEEAHVAAIRLGVRSPY